jgi:hypothetical protein
MGYKAGGSFASQYPNCLRERQKWFRECKYVTRKIYTAPDKCKTIPFAFRENPSSTVRSGGIAAESMAPWRFLHHACPQLFQVYNTRLLDRPSASKLGINAQLMHAIQSFIAHPALPPPPSALLASTHRSGFQSDLLLGSSNQSSRCSLRSLSTHPRTVVADWLVVACLGRIA